MEHATSGIDTMLSFRRICLCLMIAGEVQEWAVNSGASPVDARDPENLPKPPKSHKNAITDRRGPAGAPVAVRRIVR